MTYEQYWYDDPLMVRAFYKADKIRQERQDSEAWLQGLYILKALDATVGNLFRKQGTEPAEYPDRPFSTEQSEEITEDQEAILAEAYMNNLVRVGKGWGKKEVSASAG